MVAYIHKLFGFLCTTDVSILLQYSIIYLHRYAVMDIYFIHWVIIQYYFILLLKSFQLWPLGTLSINYCVSLTYPYHYGFFVSILSTSLLSDTKRCSRVVLHISCSIRETAIYPELLFYINFYIFSVKIFKK